MHGFKTPIICFWKLNIKNIEGVLKMARKIKNVIELTEVVENVTVETVTETTENVEVVVDETNVKEIVAEVAENVEIVENTESTENVEIEKSEESVGKVEIKTPALNKPRRKSGEASVYPINNGQYWGICLQFSNASKELKAMYGNKLRYLKTFKSYEEAVVGVEVAKSNIEGLLREKLEKLGHETKTE